MAINSAKALRKAVVLAGVLAVGMSSASAQSTSAGNSMSPMPSMGHASEDMKKTMDSCMEGMRQMKMTGDTDKDFAMMMKMHHEQALPMARVELEHGKSPELKAMASKIINDQKKEIAQFDKWLKIHQ